MALKIALLIGTRPEAIKLSPVIHALRRHPQCEVIVAGTGQHDALLQMQLEDRRLMLDWQLQGRAPGEQVTLAYLLADLLLGIMAFLSAARPDFVLVQGDTTTALAGALAAFYQGIPIGHVEAGLRSYQLREPFPEEANRRLIARLADIHFAPTERATHNLWQERVMGSVWCVGNTVVDTLAEVLQELRRTDVERPEEPLMAHLIKKWTPYVLVTCHRREALDRRLALLIDALKVFARMRPDVHVVWPLHVNPLIGRAATQLDWLGNVRLLDALPYTTFVRVLCGAAAVVTDSGGMIEEATTLGRPLLIIRDDTERPEALEAGAELVPMHRMAELPDIIEQAIKRPWLQNTWHEAFGDGAAGERIARITIDWLEKRQAKP